MIDHKYFDPHTNSKQRNRVKEINMHSFFMHFGMVQRFIFCRNMALVNLGGTRNVRRQGAETTLATKCSNRRTTVAPRDWQPSRNEQGRTLIGRACILRTRSLGKTSSVRMILATKNQNRAWAAERDWVNPNHRLAHSLHT